MSKKIILIIILVLFALGIGVGFFSWWQTKKITPTTQTPPLSNQTLPTSFVPDPDTKNVFRVQGKTESLIIHDFRPSSITLPGKGGNFLLKETNHFHIEYSGTDESFSISLLDGPLTQVRSEAETTLLQMLNITSQAACELKVSLAVPIWVSETAAGIDYGLSFCPDGLALPE